jgi:hypothetical protein
MLSTKTLLWSTNFIQVKGGAVYVSDEQSEQCVAVPIEDDSLDLAFILDSEQTKRIKDRLKHSKSSRLWLRSHSEDYLEFTDGRDDIEVPHVPLEDDLPIRKDIRSLKDHKDDLFLLPAGVKDLVIRASPFACKANTGRPGIEQVLITAGEVVATDGHAMIVLKYKTDVTLPNVLIPTYCIPQIKRMGNNIVCYRNERTTIISDRRHSIVLKEDETFPPYEAVIPPKEDRIALPFTKTIRELLNRSEAEPNDDGNFVYDVEIADEVMTILAGPIKRRFKKSWEPLRCRLDPKKLLKEIKTVTAHEVSGAGSSTELSPINVFHIHKGFIVVMGLR